MGFVLVKSSFASVDSQAFEAENRARDEVYGLGFVTFSIRTVVCCSED